MVSLFLIKVKGINGKTDNQLLKIHEFIIKSKTAMRKSLTIGYKCATICYILRYFAIRCSMEFKDKLKHVRGVLLISQNDLAKALGVSFSTINRLENGKNEPTFITRKKLDRFCAENDIIIGE